MIDPLALGATLYMPATRADLASCTFGGGIPSLRSCVICLEDAVHARELGLALARLHALLAGLPEHPSVHIFVRPRDPAMLARILRMPGADRLAGFVLPKVTAETLPLWLGELAPTNQSIMPTLETREALDPVELRRLRDQLLAVQDQVLTIRIGGNDLLQCLGLRRPSRKSVYDGPLGPLIACIAGQFLPYGFALSGPVMERYDDPQLLRAEFAQDLEHGLTSKSAIHPAQLPVIHGGLAVSGADLNEARAILARTAPAVFAFSGRMAEPATHSRWARTILRRAELYGVADFLPVALHA